MYNCPQFPRSHPHGTEHAPTQFVHQSIRPSSARQASIVFNNRRRRRKHLSSVLRFRAGKSQPEVRPELALGRFFFPAIRPNVSVVGADVGAQLWRPLRGGGGRRRRLPLALRNITSLPGGVLTDPFKKMHLVSLIFNLKPTIKIY